MSSRNRLRGNWSSTMTSASAPSSLPSHDDNSPAAARCHRPRKRRTSASKASSRRYQRSGPASRQKAKMPAGVTEASTIGEGARTALRRGLLLVAQFAAQDLADIGLGQVGPELDLLGDLVGGELRAAVLDDFLGGEVRVLLDDEGFDRLAGLGVLHADDGAFQHAGMARDHFLDLVGIDVEARDQDHVLLAVDDLGEAPR